MTAKDVLVALRNIGCQQSALTGLVGLSVHFEDIKIKKADIPLFARLIRAATLLERNGHLVADIDRMGKVVGLHLGSASKE